MDERAQPTPMMRLQGRDPGPGRIVGLIAVVLLVAIAKPWAWDSSGRDGSAGIQPALPASTTRPTPTPDPQAVLRHHCLEPSGWRVYSHETWGSDRVRSWKSLEPARAANGPLDARLPVVRVSPDVTAVGYCAPWRGPERPPADARLTVWLVLPSRTDGQAVAALPLVYLPPAPGTTLGGLYAPESMGLWFGEVDKPDASASPDTHPWPVNRYVFALRSDTWERWWSVQVGDPPRWSTPAPTLPRTGPPA